MFVEQPLALPGSANKKKKRNMFQEDRGEIYGKKNLYVGDNKSVVKGGDEA